MPKLSSTSPRTTRPSYASCVVMSLNSLTALIRCAGGAVAMDAWATSLQSTSSPFITASDLTSCQTSARPFLQVHRRAILKDTHAAPPLCTRPSTSWSKRRSYHRTTRSLNWFLPMPPVMSPFKSAFAAGSSDHLILKTPLSPPIQTWTFTLWRTLTYIQSHTYSQL